MSEGPRGSAAPQRPTGLENGRKSHCDAAVGTGCWSRTSWAHLPFTEPLQEAPWQQE